MDPIDPSEIPLRDIHLPEAISWWPLAIGWWLILIGLVAIAVALWWYFRKPRVSNKKKIMQSLDSIERDYLSERNAHKLAQRLSTLARQIALLDDAEGDDLHSLVGPEWSKTWQGRLGESSLSADELHRALSVAPYRKNEAINGEELINAFRASLDQPRPPSGNKPVNISR